MKVKTGVPFLVMASVLSMSVQAAEYSVTPYASARAEADTNKRLTTQNADTTFGAVLDLGAVFNAATEESSLSVTPRLNIGRFSDDGNNVDQDREDYYIDMTGNHRFNERWSAGAFFNYANVGVVASELDDIGLVVDGSDVFATGNVVVPENFSRQTISFGPSLNYIFSEKDTLSVGASYTDATYDRQDTNLSDYNNYSVNASWTRQVNITDQLIASVFASKQESDLNQQILTSVGPAPETLVDEFDQVGFTLGYVRQFSETLLGRVSIGVRNTDGQFPDLTDFDLNLSAQSAALINPNTGLPVGNVINRLDPLLNNQAFLSANPDFLRDSRVVNRIYQQGNVSGTGLLLDASVEKQFEKTTVTAGLSRASVPSGQGLTERSEFYVNAIHLFSDRLTGNGSFRYFSTQSESDLTLAGAGAAIDQIRLEAGLDWRMTEFWTVGAGYTYRRRSSENTDSADGHGIFVTLGYNGNRYAISR